TPPIVNCAASDGLWPAHERSGAIAVAICQVGCGEPPPATAGNGARGARARPRIPAEFRGAGLRGLGQDMTVTDVSGSLGPFTTDGSTTTIPSTVLGGATDTTALPSPTIPLSQIGLLAPLPGTSSSSTSRCPSIGRRR